MTTITTTPMRCLLICGLLAGCTSSGQPSGPNAPDAGHARAAQPAAPDPTTQGDPISSEPREDAIWAPAVDPKPCSKQVDRGIGWLTAHQLPSGAWGQGEESSRMGGGSEAMTGTPSVADTCVAALAILRSGSTPSEGPHAEALRRALDFLCKEIESAPDQGLAITDLHGTRVQGKLGPHIDTFLTAMLLAEVKGLMPEAEANARLDAARAKVITKLESNQHDDGTWGQSGWAPVLAQSMAAKAINRSAQAGDAVDATVMARAVDYARGQFSSENGSFDGEGSAGVRLYAAAGNMSALSDTRNTLDKDEKKLELEAADPTTTPTERAKAVAGLERMREIRQSETEARTALVDQLDDQGFISGFGSNGGEEFLSYLNISEALVAQGGKEWQRWDGAISSNLERIQNQDGSWTGHHCITGRTFCTATALLVLMADRTPVPITGKLRRG